MNTCSFTIHFKETSVCYTVLVESIVCFGDLEMLLLLMVNITHS